MIAAVGEGAIPRQCKRDGYIVDAEEYAMTLKTRLITKFRDEEENKIVNTDKQGNKDGGESDGYILYITYIFQ